MKFELKGKLTFSDDIGEAVTDIASLMNQATTLLQKGAPKGKESEAAKIVKWRARGKILQLTIKSGRYVRAHDALLRLAKLFSQEIGRKHKLGLREITAYRYQVILPPAKVSAQAKVELEKLPHKVKVDKVGVEISFKNLTEADLKGRVVDRFISVVEEIITQTPGKAAEPKVIKHGPKVVHPFKEDPFIAAKNAGWIVEFPGRGQWVYREPYAKLLRALEKLIIEKVAYPLGFNEAMFPKLVPLEVMQRMPGYLDGVPEGMYYVCPPPRDPEVFSGFKQKLRLTKKVPAGDLREILKNPAYVLAPAQCEPFYESFASQRVRLEDLPAKQFDRSGWTYRWEGGGVEGLVRTQEFRRIEFVFLGAPDEVVSIRDSVLDGGIKLLNELGVEWRLSVATPFYMREGRVEGDTSDSRQVATYDLEALLPYKGDWLELGSYNVHKAKFVKTFKIKEIKGREIWTGCCGFGTSRWVVGFLAQHGIDPSRWPKPIRKLVEPLPPVSRVVK